MFPKKDHIKVDLLLCPPQIGPARTAIQKFIGAHHATIQFHPRSGALCLHNQCAKPIVYENGDATGDLVLARSPKDPATKGLVHDTCVFFRQSNLLRIGDYAFVLDFDLRRANQGTFREQRDSILMREFGIRPSQQLDLVPLKHHSIAYNVCIHRRLFQSPDMQKSICSGVRLHTGEPVAVKTIRCREKKTRARVRSELYIANILRGQNGSNGVLGLIDSWCLHRSPPCFQMAVSDDGTTADETPENDVARAETDKANTDENETPRDRLDRNTVAEDHWSLACQSSEEGHVAHDLEGNSNDEDNDNKGGMPGPYCTVVYYSVPLAEYSFADMPWSVVDDRDRVRYFRQTLIGLRTMHRRGIVHGNISPKALTLQLDEATENTKAVGPNTQPSLRAVIGSLGSGWLTSGPHSRPGGAGSRSRSREPWIAPEVWDRSAHDSMAADIWGLAMSWLHTFTPSVRGKISRDSYDLLVRDMESHVAEPLRGLVQQMISWLPIERPGVEEALAHQIWAMFFDEERRRKNARTAAMKRAAGESASNMKKARFLSPEAETHTYDPEASLFTSRSRDGESSTRVRLAGTNPPRESNSGTPTARVNTKGRQK